MDAGHLALALLVAVLAANEVRRARARARAPAPTPAPADPHRMTKQEIEHLAEMVGFPDSKLAAAIALAESGGRPRALGDNGQSVGLWQIYIPMHPSYTREELFDPLKNAHAALKVSEHGRNWRPWAAFTHGTYKQFL